MSRSPEEIVGIDSAQDYIEAFKELYRLQAKGRSFSGYERHCAYLNTGGGRFANISATSGLDFSDDGRGVAHVDWDHDGDLDLWVVNRTAPQARFLRNNTQNHHFLAIRLEGVTCNRDAIGARVEIQLAGNGSDEPTSLFKTLYAGHGFVAQSSKWLHFGLGRDAKIERIVVHWPGGEPEHFTTNLFPNRFYRIVQGSSQVEPWEPPDRTVKLAASTLTPKPATTSGRVFLANAPAIPLLTYQDTVGNEISLNHRVDRPTLVNLWASWCLPCHAELESLVRFEQKLLDAGVDVIALSVDGLDKNKPTTPEDARSYLEKIGFRFTNGLATSETLSKLQLLHNILFYRVIPIQVPTSFLFADGRVHAIYRGPIEVHQVLKDARHIRDEPLRRRLLATPFAGRWAEPPRNLRVSMMADLFEKQSYYEDAVMYRRQAVAMEPADAELRMKLGLSLKRSGQLPEATRNYRQALRIDPQNLEAHNNLGVVFMAKEQYEQAIDHFKQVIQLKPDHATAHLNLGISLASLQQPRPAIEHFRQATLINPYLSEAYLHMGHAHRILRQNKQAAKSYQQAITVRPDWDQSHYYLGALLHQQNMLDEAIAHFRKATSLNPENGMAYHRLAVALDQSGRPNQSLKPLQQAIQLLPNHPAVLNSLAWILATSPDPAIQDPAKALALAHRATDLTEERNAAVLDTLAAAYAATGQFDKAVTNVEKAITLAQQFQAEVMLSEFHERLELYKQSKPYTQNDDQDDG